MTTRTSRLKISYFLYGLLALLILTVVFVYSGFRASLPRLEGTVVDSSLNAKVQVERDKNGAATITGDNRLDVAFATGFLHGQERFFQMDLYRRMAAGELSELFGPGAFGADEFNRFHRFRARAKDALALVPEDQLELLNRYVDGVNVGLADLDSKPFEYWLVGSEPKAWTIEDTILVTYTMVLDLQDERGIGEYRRSLLQKSFSSEMYEFLLPSQTEWEATITPDPVFSGPLEAPALELSTAVMPKRETSLASLGDEIEPGSNNWAVSGLLTESGAAILANDMHLGISVPATWFRLHLKVGDSLDVSGVSLPGTPLIIAGSNGSVAWGYTNNRMDTGDLIELKLNPENDQEYLTPDGYKPFTVYKEVLRAGDGSSKTMTIRETIWGPVSDRYKYKNPIVHKWTAYHPEGVNVNLLKMEQVKTVEDALRLAPEMGIAPQNALLADKHGTIAWTLFGKIPVRKPGDYDVFGDWSDGTLGWTGWTTYENHPRVVNPASGRLWTANNRPLGLDDMGVLGHQRGYVHGARARQIRDDMNALSKPVVEDDLFQIMFDDRALFLARWQKHILEVLETSENAEMKAFIEPVKNWGARAVPESVGFRLVRTYRYSLYNLLVERQVDAACQQRFEDCEYSLATQNWESPLWQLIQQQPDSWLPEGTGNWQGVFEQAARDAWDDVFSGQVALEDYTWGEHTRAQFNHPMSEFVPGLGLIADMPHVPQYGESEYMPKVTTRSSGQSEHLVVMPGDEENGILNIPSGQSGHPLSPYYGAGHMAWQNGERTPFLAGETKWQFELSPK